jgi:CheY-like chemotaxis protein
VVALAGYETMYFSSAPAAIEALKILQPQLIILEYHAQATEVLNYLYATGLRHIPILGLVSSQKEAEDFITQGAKEVLIKPFKRQPLLDTVYNLLTPK